MNEPSSDERALSLRAAVEAKRKLAEVRLIMENVAHELDGPRFWRYAHNMSGGLQEYIEALSFCHYVECGRLVSYEQVQANLSDDAGRPVRGSQTSLVAATKLMRQLISSSFQLRFRTMLSGYLTLLAS